MWHRNIRVNESAELGDIIKNSSMQLAIREAISKQLCSSFLSVCDTCFAMVRGVVDSTVSHPSIVAKTMSRVHEASQLIQLGSL